MIMETPASSQHLITPEDVLESLMNDGTIDAIRMKIITLLKADEELKNTTVKMVEQSRVLNTPGAEKQTKRELFDALRQELETSGLEKASKSVWEMMLDSNGLEKEISETVERVFCRLSGKEAPLYPQNIEALLEKARDGDAEASRENELKRNTENSHSASKNRKIDKASKEDGANEVADESNAAAPGPFGDSSRVPHQSAKT